MTILVAMPQYNTAGKSDASGAFHPEAFAFCRLHGGTPAQFNNRIPMRHRFEEVLKWINHASPGSVKTLAMFCHGYKTGLQCGVTNSNAAQFAIALQTALAPGPRIVLYACDAARDTDDDRSDDTAPGPGGDGGFADKLRHELSTRGVKATIYAHSTAGHTTRNPFVRRFDPDELAGGHWVVTPHSPLWRTWVRSLRDGTLRFRFPFMTQAELERELVSPPSVA